MTAYGITLKFEDPHHPSMNVEIKNAGITDSKTFWELYKPTLEYFRRLIVNQIGDDDE
jgi:hypothetical protein